MIRRILVLLMLCVACAFLNGCDSWMDGEYAHITPNVSRNEQINKQTHEISNYIELRSALISLVEEGRTNGVIYVNGIEPESIDNYMNMASEFVMRSNALGAYAVQDIQYIVGTNAGRQAIATEITYYHSRPEILKIKHTREMSEALQLMTNALERCESGIVVRVDNYKTVDIPQIIQEYVDMNPKMCMETPVVVVDIYPTFGFERIIEVSYTYQNSRDVLHLMQDIVQPVFSSAELYISADADDWEKCAQLYSFLMERFEYKLETSITPSYSLLRYGVGDSKAFATVYAAMCRQVGLECFTVSGTKEGVPAYWNAILMDGVYYHVDLLACSELGEFAAKTNEEMIGYVWDYAMYPGE